MNASKSHTPELRVLSDYDQYFEQLVDSWITRKRDAGTAAFKHTAIVVTAGPYRESAVSFESKDGVLRLDFYAALRVGFGFLSEEDVAAIVELL